MNKILVSFVLLLSTLGLSFVASAQPKPGKDFDAVTQVIGTDTPNKIEVMEIFWYGCSHCYQMETPLTPWVKKLPADVSFKRVPGLPNPSWAPMAKAFFTMESFGVTDKLHHKLFDAIHKQKKLDPTNEKAAIDWLANTGGLDRKEVESTFNSFTINTNLKRAAQIFRYSGATGVPSLVIDGKYITSGTMAGGNAKALAVADYIIKNVRISKAKDAKPTKK